MVRGWAVKHNIASSGIIMWVQCGRPLDGIVVDGHGMGIYVANENGV